MRRRMKVGKEFNFSVSLEDDTSFDKLKKRTHAPRRIAVGKPFDAKIALGANSAGAQDASTRTRIVWFVLAMCALFLFGAAAVGFRDGQFSAIENVWSVVGPTYGGIAAYYFFRRK